MNDGRSTPQGPAPKRPEKPGIVVFREGTDPTAPDPASIPQTPTGEGSPVEQSGPQSIQFPPLIVPGDPFTLVTGTRWPTKSDCIRGDYYTAQVRGLHGDLAWMRGLTVRMTIAGLAIGMALGSLITWGIMR